MAGINGQQRTAQVEWARVSGTDGDHALDDLLGGELRVEVAGHALTSFLLNISEPADLQPLPKVPDKSCC
ncbi:hypothetical protein ACFWJS_40300 [Streptomyces sp. NPDC127061]|uniref:hypothetical protein n=1 Tax=unclassified Streptomyces TaxID=2593676 RepID=UPI00364BE7D1